MLGVLIATVVATAALLWVVLYVLREESVKRERIDEELHEGQVPKLEYDVPTGQDPVVVLAALERAGFTATVDPHHAHQLVMIACPEGVDRQRARVRSVIESATLTAPADGIPLEVDVRFRDEE